MTSNKFSRTLRIAGAAAVAGLASASLLAIDAAPASAAPSDVLVTKVNGVVTVTTPNVAPKPGETASSAVWFDDYLDRTGTLLRVLNGVGGATAQAGCTQITSTEVRCGSTASISKIVVQGSSYSEVVYAFATFENLDFYGRGGNDGLIGSKGQDMFDAGAGNDAFEDDGFGSTDVIKGGTGIDEVSYERATGPVQASPENRPSSGQPGEGDRIGTDVENLTGSAFGDDLLGTSESYLPNTANKIVGGGGSDYINGFDGNDTLIGDGGVGTAGNDHIAGGDGDDHITGGDGDDHLYGQLGADLLFGENGTDDADGGPDAYIDSCDAEVEVSCEA
jgi:Ca2+-binding RTX toxin-like protein